MKTLKNITFLSLVVISLVLNVFIWNGATASTNDMPVSNVDASQEGFDSMDDAATAGVRAAITASETVEYAGAVYAKGVKYFYTLPVSQKQDNGVDYRIQIPGSAKLVAIYHTHPANVSSEAGQFSKSDCDTAKRMNMVMYVGVVASKKVIQYDPSRDHPHFTAFQMYSDFFGGKTIDL